MRLRLKLTCSGAKLSFNDSFLSHHSFGSIHRFIPNLPLSFRPSLLSLSLCLILLSQGAHPPCCLALLPQGLRLRALPFNHLCIYHQLTIGRARTAGIAQIMTRQMTPTSSGNMNTSFFLRGYVLRYFTQPLTISSTLFRH